MAQTDGPEAEPGAPARTATAPALPATSYGALLDVIRSRPGLTRGQLLAATGMSRTTLFARLEVLFRAGYVYQDGSAPAGSGDERRPGRRSELLRWDTRDKVALVLDLGQTRARVCMTSVGGQVLRVREVSADIHINPGEYLATIFDIADVLVRAGTDETLVGVAVGIPAPINPLTGGLGATTSMMAPWERYPLLDVLRERWHVPAVIENDARAFALGEASVLGPGRAVLAIKYATGIGAGIVDAGHVLEGADGAAGDIGHVRISDDGPLCTCGRHGCLASWASGQALIRDLQGTGVRNLWDIVDRVSAGDPLVCDAVDEAAARLSRVLSTVVAAANPDALVLGGVLGRMPRVVSTVEEHIREDVAERARHRLRVSAAHLGADGGVIGLSRKLVDLVYAPTAIDRAILGEHESAAGQA
ncbi:ROK family protein [Pseudactinotalea suaedae]|uniref:ROK family protein n=1 Tax=Pseudactinotalea suaedae TaxID=1524924 RepID=UPI0012E2DA7F|nr:ROK family protein [Pseudactinotalea suaedae]